MKTLLVFALVVLAGCRTAAPIAPLPLPAKPVAEPRPIAVTPPPANAVASIAASTAALEQKNRQQAQLIEALISQNDALTAKLAALPPTPPPPATVVASSATPPSGPLPPIAPPPTVVPVPPPSVVPTPAPALVLLPNAEGMIDLVAAAAATKSDEPVNPFVLRAAPPESMQEISLRVGGIIAGPVPCAIVNERLVQSGETVESFAVERIEADAVFLRRGEHTLRLPVAEKPARVRLAL